MSKKIYYIVVVPDSDFDKRFLIGFAKTFEAAKRVYREYVDKHNDGIYAPLYGKCEDTFLFR